MKSAIAEMEIEFAEMISASSKTKKAFAELKSATSKMKIELAETISASSKMILDDGFWVKNVKKPGFLKGAETALNAEFNGTY